MMKEEEMDYLPIDMAKNIESGVMFECEVFVASRPWPKRCSIQFYDLPSDAKVGDIIPFYFQNGSAEYIIEEKKEYNFSARLLEGSDWKEPE
jgi:hypothetical protein